jgi:hypothetical protein
MGLCEGKEKKYPEIENLFMTRAKSHEIMMMLFRAKHMGNCRDVLKNRAAGRYE